MWLKGTMAVVLALTACGGNGGTEDQAACEALRDAEGENEGIYADLRAMDLSTELRGALDRLEAAGQELGPETIEAAGEVASLCREAGVELQG
jgi:hypothetical protein